MTEQFQEKSGDKYTCGVIYTVSSSDIALSSLDEWKNYMHFVTFFSLNDFMILL